MPPGVPHRFGYRFSRKRSPKFAATAAMNTRHKTVESDWPVRGPVMVSVLMPMLVPVLLVLAVFLGLEAREPLNALRRERGASGK